MEMNTNTATQPPPRHTTVHLALASLPSCRWQSNAPLTSPEARSNSHQRAQMACLKRAVTRRVHTQVHTHTHTRAKTKIPGKPTTGPSQHSQGGNCFLLPAAMSTPVSSARKNTSLTTADRMYTMGVTGSVTRAGEGSPLLLRSPGGDGAGGGAAGHAAGRATGCETGRATGRATCQTAPKPTAGSAARGPPWTGPGISFGPS